MVKFRERKMKKRYKRNVYGNKKYLMEFPVKVNEEISLTKTKISVIDITSKDTPRKELFNIQLIRTAEKSTRNLIKSLEQRSISYPFRYKQGFQHCFSGLVMCCL